MYLTSQKIPELQGLKLQERMLVVKQAVSQLSVPQKIVLNSLKLFILSAFFIIFARFEGWILVPYLLLAGLSYPLIINPVTFMFTRKELPKAREKLGL